MITSVLYTTVYVTDQERALDFYRDKLGLEVTTDYSGPEGRFLSVGTEGGNVDVVLWPTEEVRPVNDDNAEPGVVPGPIILETEDLQGLFEELAAKGVSFEEAAPVDYPFGVRATALDPDGNRISLRQRRAAKRGK